MQWNYSGSYELIKLFNYLAHPKMINRYFLLLAVTTRSQVRVHAKSEEGLEQAVSDLNYETNLLLKVLKN